MCVPWQKVIDPVFLDIENDSTHSGLVYSSAKVGKDDASSVASLSLLSVGDI